MARTMAPFSAGRADRRISRAVRRTSRHHL